LPLKVLLADDSMTAQNMAKKILTDAGYQVIAVSNGAQALKKLASEKPDLVVLDVYMPGYSGLEVCERIKNAPDTARIPVVLCVAKMEPFKPEEGARVRADAVIVKPFEATDLVARVQELGSNIQRRTKPQKIEEPEPTAAESEVTDVVAQTSHISHVNVPQELAVEPAAGMELVTEEPSPAAGFNTSFPTSFEIQHEREPIEATRDVRMQAADGLSGVFELPPSIPAQEAAPEFEIVAQSAGSAKPASDNIRDEADSAARIESRPEFVVDRLSISIPLSGPEHLPHAEAPSTPVEPLTIEDSAKPMDWAPQVTEVPTTLEPQKQTPGLGYTGIYEFAPPKGSLESPAVETRIGEVRSAGITDLVESMISAPQAFSPVMENTSAVSVETAEETISAVPLPVWVAEEVALDQCDLNISLEEEMRAALASAEPTSAAHVELPLGVAAERIAAFTTEQAAPMPVESYERQHVTAADADPAEPSENAAEMYVDQSSVERARESFEALSDEMVCETSAASAWHSGPETSAAMPEPGAMDAVASLQGPVTEFSAEATVSPDFSIPGHSFDAVPADEFGPPTSAPTTIEAESYGPEHAKSHSTGAVSHEPDVHVAQPDPLPAESTLAADQPQHALGAMAQAIVDSPELYSLKGAAAEPVVEAIVTRMLEQIKPELIVHVLRELEKK